jgi:hypothetical protein
LKKVIAIVLALMLSVALVTPVLGAATVYTDKAAWEAAVEAYATEDSSDAALNPEISVASDNGYVDTVNGVWWDRVDDGDWGDYGETTWTFAAPICAWGGTFDAYNPGGPGSSILVEYLDGTTAVVGIIPNTTADTFWGFVSDEPFTKVHLEDAALIGGACETYEMDDMVYSFAGTKVTGGGTVDWGGGRVTYGFVAQMDASGAVKGEAQFQHRDVGVRDHADVLFLAVSGADAWIGAVITQSDNPGLVGQEIYFRVQDNGQGKKATGPDMVSTVILGPAVTALSMPPLALLQWTNGNVMIH